MNNRAIIVAIVDKLIECATKAWTDESFKARFEAAAGSALDALHKRPDDNYGISNFAAAFLVASSMGVVMREGPGNRYNRIQRELLSEIISRFPEFPDATKSVSAYLNTLMQRSPERLLEAGEGAATLEERKAKGIGFWSFMWLGHQIAKGMVKGEVMGAVVAPCAEFLPEFDYFLRKSLTDMFGEGVETHTPIAVSNKTGCVVPLAVALVGVCAVAVSVSKWCS